MKQKEEKSQIIIYKTEDGMIAVDTLMFWFQKAHLAVCFKISEFFAT